MDGVSVVHELTVPHRVESIRPRTQAPCPVRLSAAVKFISYRGIGSRKCSFPAKCMGIFDDETFRLANDGALALHEKIAAGMDFRVTNRL